MHMAYFRDENARFSDAKRMTDFVDTADNTHSQTAIHFHHSNHLKHTLPGLELPGFTCIKVTWIYLC